MVGDCRLLAVVSNTIQYMNSVDSWKSHVPFLRCSNFLFKTILWISEVVTSWWVLAHEVKYIFENVFSIVNDLVMELGQLIDVIVGNVFRKYYGWFGGVGTKSIPVLVFQATAINQKITMMGSRFLTLLKVLGNKT